MSIDIYLQLLAVWYSIFHVYHCRLTYSRHCCRNYVQPKTLQFLPLDILDLVQVSVLCPHPSKLSRIQCAQVQLITSWVQAHPVGTRRWRTTSSSGRHMEYSGICQHRVGSWGCRNCGFLAVFTSLCFFSHLRSVFLGTSQWSLFHRDATSLTVSCKQLPHVSNILSTMALKQRRKAKEIEQSPCLRFRRYWYTFVLVWIGRGSEKQKAAQQREFQVWSKWTLT